MTILYVLLSILLLGILIAIHEWGHFMAARLMKIDVREFAIGMGPKLIGWKSKKYETVFSLRLIPLGGFCAFYGEDDVTGEQQADPRAFGKQKVWKRIFTIAMGPLMNFILAIAVAVVCYAAFGIYEPDGTYDLYVKQVMGAGPAYAAGFHDGDVILKVDGVDITGLPQESALSAFSEWKEENGPLTVTVRRGGETADLTVTPEWDEEQQKMVIGVMMTLLARTEHRRLPFGECVTGALSWCAESGSAIIEGLGQLISGRQGIEQVSGPVGVVSMVTELVMDNGMSVWFELLVLLSVNLGIMNLLPIPGLDGSRILFGLLEAIRGKPVEQRREALIHLIGILILFAFMIFLTVKDVVGLFR